MYTISPDPVLTPCSKLSFIDTRTHHGPMGSIYALIYIATNCSSVELQLAQNDGFIKYATEAAEQTIDPEWFSFHDPAIDYL